MGNIELDETSLWSRSLMDEGDLFGLLFDRHCGRVFRDAYRLCPDCLDADDGMATVFLEVWRRREKVRVVGGAILPWLLVTTTDVARNVGCAACWYRKLLNSLPRADDVRDSLDEVFSGAPLDAVDHELAVGLCGLSTMGRQLVVLEGYTMAAAATILGLPPSAAKTRMYRARERLKAMIKRSSQIAAKELTNGVMP